MPFAPRIVAAVAAAAAALLPPERAAAAAAPGQPDTLAQGERIEGGGGLTSASGLGKLNLQKSDGNLVLYDESTSPHTALWTAKTTGHPGDYLTLQSDGDLVVYDDAGAALWRSNTAGSGATRAVLQTNCDLVLRDAGGNAVWGTATTCVAPAPPTPAPPPAPPSSRTNVAFVLLDDWGWGDVGYHKSICHDAWTASTPRIDKLAAEGTAFTDFHTMGAECSPSRASFMTGRSPSDKKVRIHLVIGDHANNVAKGCADFLDPATATVTSVMKKAGYATGHFGKWHLGSIASGTGAAPALSEYGIDESVSYVSNPNVNTYFKVAGGKTNPFSDKWFPANSSRMIVDLGTDFMGRAKAAGTPFYVNLWLHISHAPLNPTEEQLTNFPTSGCPGPNPGNAVSRCAIQIYRASQYEADKQVGRVADWLVAEGLKSKTLLAFATDNGPEDPHTDMHAVGDPGPFRGRKRSLYEGGIRVPFFVWGRGVPSGKVSAEDVASIDWLPTAAAVVGVALSPADAAGLMGRDASPLLFGTGAAPRQVPAMFDYRNDNSKTGNCWHGAPRLAIRQGELKLLTNTNPKYPRTELYNLSANTFEQDNLAGLAQYAGTVASMTKTVVDWADTLDPLVDGGMGTSAQHMGCLEYHMPS